jgi:hypothetical protein
MIPGQYFKVPVTRKKKEFKASGGKARDADVAAGAHQRDGAATSEQCGPSRCQQQLLQ